MPELSNVGILSAFVAGIISFLSPCVLPLVPGYVSYVAGRSSFASPSGEIAVARSATLGLSLCFVLGFTTVFVILGASATALGQLLLQYRYETNIFGGVIVIDRQGRCAVGHSTSGMIYGCIEHGQDSICCLS